SLFSSPTPPPPPPPPFPYTTLFRSIGDALRNPRLAPLMIAWALAPFAFSGYTVAIPLWANLTFGWREQQLGWFFTVIGVTAAIRSEEHTSELQSRFDLVCRLLLEKK